MFIIPKKVMLLARAGRLPLKPGSAGFTLIEIIFVISIIGLAYFVALPQFNLATGSDVAVKLGQVATDIRSAFDNAVLSGKTHRMVFVLATGEYWLEVTNKEQVLLGDEKLDRDPTPEEEKTARDEFDARLKEYQDLLGEGVLDPETDKRITPISPLIKYKDRIAPPKWERVNSLEWQPRSIGPYLLFQDIQAEHHNRKQDFSDLGVKAVAMIYFYPKGYVERAVLHVAHKKGELQIDDSVEPYTIITSPTEGTAEVNSGYEELAETDEK